MPTVFSYSLVSPFSATQHTLLGCDAVTGEVHRYDLSNLDTLVPIASQAEAEAGTNNAKMMTPLRTAQAIAASSFVKADGTVSMTGQLTLPASNPTNANHAARKAYVDAGDLWAKLTDAAVSNSTIIDVTGFSLQDYRMVTVLLLGARFGSQVGSGDMIGQLYRNGSLVNTGYTWQRDTASNLSLSVNYVTNVPFCLLGFNGGNVNPIFMNINITQNASNEEGAINASVFYTNGSNVLVNHRVSSLVPNGSGWVDGLRITAPVAFQNNVGRVVVMGLKP
jgi:hypothetical protein